MWPWIGKCYPAFEKEFKNERPIANRMEMADLSGNHSGSYDDKIVDTIFDECGCDARGRVAVSDLIQFMTREAKPPIGSYHLRKLWELLDPEDCDARVTRNVFRKCVKLWGQSMQTHNSPDLGVIDSAPLHHSSPVSSRVGGQCEDVLDISDVSTYSCGSSEALINSSNEICRLVEQGKKLEHILKNRDQTIQELQSQLHLIEENCASLQVCNEELQHKIASLQAVTKQYSVLQKESEQLKETSAVMELEITELKARNQQLRRDAQAYVQELKHLENQNVELTTQLEMRELQQKECQQLVTEQKLRLEELSKQCSQYEKQREQHCRLIAELEETVASQLSTIKHLQDEKESLALRLLDTEDELLSAHSQLSQASGKKVDLDRASDDSTPRSPLPQMSEHPSIFMELQSLKNSFPIESSFPDLIEGVGDGSDRNDSIKKSLELRDQEIQCLVSPQQHREIQTKPTGAAETSKSVTTQTPELGADNPEPQRKRKKRFRCSEEAQREIELGASPALISWIHEIETLAARCKKNLQVCPGRRNLPLDMTPQLKRASSMEYDKLPCPVSTSTPGSQELISGPAASKQRPDKEEPDCNGGIRRCLSESQVLAQDGGSEASSSTEAFPSLPDVVLQQLGLTMQARTTDVLSDQDVESKCSSLALAFKTDKLTLMSRHDRQQRQRDQAEKNMAMEVMNLKAIVHNLNYLCKDSESIDILTKMQEQVDILQQLTERVSSSAEMYGAVQQESRLSKAFDVMLQHMQNLKRLYEKSEAKLEEARRVLLEYNIVVDGSVDNAEAGPPRHKRYNSLVTLVGSAAKQGRRASIAAFARPQVSGDLNKSSTSYITFRDVKSMTQARCTSLSPSAPSLDNPAPSWDPSDRLLRPGVDDIEEVKEVRKHSLSKLENQEENNNSQEDGLTHDRLRYSDSDNDALPPETSIIEVPQPSMTFSDQVVNFLCSTYVTFMNYILPVNVDRVVTQTRRFATVLLLVAALLCLVSIFIPTNAQSRNCFQYSSWISLEEIFRPYVRLRHYAPPPV